MATAGPDLESVLAARGAGADKFSTEKRTVVANLDVGGGTSNIAIYQKGVLRGTACLDIGGRLIKIENGRIAYIFNKIQKLAGAHGISIAVGDRADEAVLMKICRLMASQLAEALYLREPDAENSKLYTNDGKALPREPAVKAVTFSGGVADCIYQDMEGDPFKFGDIGVLLGRAIKEDPDFQKIEIYRATETIRATVVGAGVHTTEVSGSTIHYERDLLPLKNIPILKVPQEDEVSMKTLTDSIIKQMPLYKPEGKVEQIAIALSGESYNSFVEVQTLAKAIVQGAEELIESSYPLIVVVENDIGKVLGNALNVMLDFKKEVVCIDSIQTMSGDYIDIGEPVAGGQVLPVVIKTLIFNS